MYLKYSGVPSGWRLKSKCVAETATGNRRHRLQERETLYASQFVYTEFILWYATTATSLSSSPFAYRQSSQHVQGIMTYISRYLDHG